MRKVDLSEIPRRGAQQKQYDWSNSIGRCVKFVYDDIQGELVITSHSKEMQCVFVNYNSNDYKIYTSDLPLARLGRVVGKITSEFRFNIGSVVADDRRDLKIIEREKRGKHKYYKYICNKCTCESWISESNLINLKRGCAGCNSKMIVIGFNDITTKAPWMIPYIKGGYDVATTLAPNSSKKILMVCPDCGTERLKSPNKLCADKSLGCKCGGGFSYPERFMSGVLDQLNLEYEWGFDPEWLRGYNGSKYKAQFDFCIHRYNLIIEIDGPLGHGKHIHSRSSKTIEGTKKKDEWKDNKAKENGFAVLRINADESDINYMKQSISDVIGDIFDLSNIDWHSCNSNAQSNRVKEVCEYYESNKPVLIMDVMKRFGISDQTVRRYLKSGNELGWCKYDKKMSYKNRWIASGRSGVVA